MHACIMLIVSACSSTRLCTLKLCTPSLYPSINYAESTGVCVVILLLSLLLILNEYITQSADGGGAVANAAPATAAALHECGSLPRARRHRQSRPPATVPDGRWRRSGASRSPSTRESCSCCLRSDASGAAGSPACLACTTLDPKFYALRRN